MLEAVSALSIFLISHVVLSENPTRAWLIHHLGQRVHFLLYSLLSIALIWWASDATQRASVIALWPAIPALHLVPIITLPFALFLAVCGVSQNNPSSLVAERLAPAALLRRQTCGILTVTRNPVMWALGLWALSHAIASNGLAELLRFGAFAALAILGSYRIDRKVAARWGEPAWSDFTAQTSNLPLLAVLQHRVRLDWRSIGWIRPAIAVLLYGLIVMQHQAWFGLSVTF